MWFVDPVTLLVLVVTFVLLRWCLKEPPNLPPGPRRWPIIGSLPTIMKHPPEKGYLNFHELKQKYGGLFTVKVGSFYWIVITDPEVAKEVFVKQASNFSDRPVKSKMMDYLKEKMGDFGVIWASGESRKEVRRFTISAMREFGFGKRTMEHRIQEELQAMREDVRKVEGNAWNPNSLMTLAVSNVICSICYGDRYSYDDATFIQMLDQLTVIAKNVTFAEPAMVFSWLNFLPISNRMKANIENNIKFVNYIDEQLEAHKANFTPGDPRSLVDLYFDKSQEKDEKVITAVKVKMIIVDLFFAGSDTTSNAMTWALLYMIGYPEVQKKCHDEIDQIIGPSRLPEVTDKKNMPYVEATINEILRISSTAPMSLPHVAEDTANVCGYTIPAGSAVMLALYAYNMDPNIWPEPHLFKPERWLDENGKLTKPEFLGFGIGQRVCPGEHLARHELFIFFTGLLQHFTFMKESPEAVLDYEGNQGITMSCKPYKLIPKLRKQ